MTTFVIIAAILAMIGVVIVLGLGIFGMAKGGEFNEKYGTRLMQWRVYLQGIALGLLALAYFMSQSS